MSNLVTTFIERSDQWKVALLEHLQISLISLFIAMLIAIPFAIIVANKKKISEVTLQIAGIMQTMLYWDFLFHFWALEKYPQL